MENLLKYIIGGEIEQQGQEPAIYFNEQVSGRLEEYQQQLHVDNALQEKLAQQILSQQKLAIPILPT